MLRGGTAPQRGGVLSQRGERTRIRRNLSDSAAQRLREALCASERRCAPQRGGVLSALRVPVNVREALAGGTRRAGREFVSLSGGGNAAVVTGAVRRPSPRPRCRGGGHSTGKAGRSNHAAELSRLAWRVEVRAAGRMPRCTREGIRGKCAEEQLCPQVSLAKGHGGRADRIAKCNAKG